jgi:hypothetical protein
MPEIIVDELRMRTGERGVYLQLSSDARVVEPDRVKKLQRALEAIWIDHRSDRAKKRDPAHDRKPALDANLICTFAEEEFPSSLFALDSGRQVGNYSVYPPEAILEGDVVVRVQFDRRLSDEDREQLRSLVAAWAAYGSRGMFGAPVHNVGRIGFEELDRMEVADWWVDLGRNGAAPIDGLVSALASTEAVRMARTLRVEIEVQ